MQTQTLTPTQTHLSATPLATRLAQVQAQTAALAVPLSAEDCQVQSMPDASPTKWHLAHTAWFFETFVLERFKSDYRPFDASFKVLFNSYYNAVGDKGLRTERGLISRPSLRTVNTYRASVQEQVLELLHSQADNGALHETVLLGTHHEQQHQELLLTDIKHALSRNPALPAYAARWPIVAVKPQALAWLGYAGGLQLSGYQGDADGAFCFDNEQPQHANFLHPFELASRPTTYGDYLAFMADGGYARPELWLSMGWDWVQASARTAPMYWQQMGSVWHNFTLQGLVAVDANTPLPHLSYFEADAYARWAQARLPTEAEWEHAARGSAAKGAIRGNLLESRAFHTLPQNGAGEAGLQQMIGDLWEWTQSSYSAYPGYAPPTGAVGEYNGKFMCSQYVLRGGSCVTPLSHIRASYRNFFPPQAQWQFSGLRLARDA
jgi:ergothioneine biosynthesis protein EgtB